MSAHTQSQKIKYLSAYNAGKADMSFDVWYDHMLPELPNVEPDESKVKDGLVQAINLLKKKGVYVPQLQALIDDKI
jgi:hypothetical protein